MRVLQQHAERVREYASALALFSSPVPEDWDSARERLDKLYPFLVWEDDWDLIKKTGEAGTAGGEARRVLGIRGQTIDAVLVFSGPFDPKKWDDAHARVRALDEFAQVYFVMKVYGMLLFKQFRDRWPHYRLYLVKADKPALETGTALAGELAEKMSEALVVNIEDLKQVCMVLIGFGDRGRPQILKLLSHPKVNVRRTVLAAIGESADAAYLDEVAERLRTDDDWQVRVAAADALGKMHTEPRRAGLVLVERLKAERDRFLRQRIVEALGECKHLEAVPVLVNALQVPNADFREAVMFALWRITGLRYTRATDWQMWYTRSYKQWLQDTRR